MAIGSHRDAAALSEATDRYLELVRACPLRTIRSDAELDRAIAMLDRLMDQGQRTEDEDDYMDVLAGIVERYEDLHYPMPSDRDEGGPAGNDPTSQADCEVG